MEIFNNETVWREYLYENFGSKGSPLPKNRATSLGKMMYEVDTMKHFTKNKDQVNLIIRTVAIDMGASEEDIEKLTVSAV